MQSECKERLGTGTAIDEGGACEDTPFKVLRATVGEGKSDLKKLNFQS